MRTILVSLLALLVLALPLCACSSGACNNGAPTFTLRAPLMIDREPPTAAGERLRYIPQPAILAAPSWSAIQAPNACSQNSCQPPAVYTPLPSSPCAPPTDGGVPQSIPAVKGK